MRLAAIGLVSGGLRLKASRVGSLGDACGAATIIEASGLDHKGVTYLRVQTGFIVATR